MAERLSRDELLELARLYARASGLAWDDRWALAAWGDREAERETVARCVFYADRHVDLCAAAELLREHDYPKLGAYR